MINNFFSILVLVIWRLTLTSNCLGANIQNEILPLVIKIGTYRQYNEMSIWPPQGLAERPLLIVAHGNGTDGSKEINHWLALAKKEKITVVCPTFVSSWDMTNILDDRLYFRECVKWIEANLKYDQTLVFITGYSGGGCPVWYLATAYPDLFRGILLQSANFYGEHPYLDLSKWRDKPIRLEWGGNDLPQIITQNKQALRVLSLAKCENVGYEIIEGIGHAAQREWAIKQMKKLSVNPNAKP
jgi:predicted esterase